MENANIFYVVLTPTPTPLYAQQGLTRKYVKQGWGLLSQFSPFRYFPYFPLLSKQTLAIEYHVYIWQVLPQLSCGDTCQIWMWFRESNKYFRNIENFAYGEISERSFSNPHPRAITRTAYRHTIRSRYWYYLIPIQGIEMIHSKWYSKSIPTFDIWEKSNSNITKYGPANHKIPVYSNKMKKSYMWTLCPGKLCGSCCCTFLQHRQLQ